MTNRWIDTLKRSEILAPWAIFLQKCGHSLAPRGSFSISENYDEYFAEMAFLNPEQVSAYRLKRYRSIATLIAREGGTSILDVALGDASTLLYLKKKIPSLISICGMDLSMRSVDHARKLGLTAFQMNLSEVSIEAIRVLHPEPIDWIIATEVLEHIPNPEVVLRTLTQIARKGVLISVPNTGFFPFRMQLLLGRFPKQWDLWPGEHLRFWTYRDFHWWLRGLNLRGAPTVYFGIPFISRIWKNLFADGILWHITSIENLEGPDENDPNR